MNTQAQTALNTMSAIEILEAYTTRQGDAIGDVTVDQNFDAETTTITFEDGSSVEISGSNAVAK